MQITDCIKAYNSVIHKVISPEDTFERSYSRLCKMKSRILLRYAEIKNIRKIPQYTFYGTDQYKHYVPSLAAHGKGHTKQQAKASGIMEMIERYSCFKYALNGSNISFVTPTGERSENMVNPESLLTSFPWPIDKGPLLEVLLAEPLKWYECRTISNDKKYLPLGFIIDFLMGSNGMAAGNTIEEAILQGICEIVERHCKTLIEIGRIATPIIELGSIECATAVEIIDKYQSIGDTLVIKDCSLGIGIPVIGVVRLIQNKYILFTIGVATNKEEALIRALTENSQTHDYRRFKPLTEKRYHFDGGTIPFSRLRSIDEINIRTEILKVNELLKKRGCVAYYFDSTDEELGVPAAIVYISGMRYAFRIDHGEYMRAKSYNVKNELHFALLREALSLGSLDVAESHIKHIKKGSASYNYIKGHFLRAKGDYESAIRHFRRHLKNGKHKQFVKDALVELASSFFENNEMAKACTYFVSARNRYPGEVTVFGYMAFFLQGLIERANRKARGQGQNKKWRSYLGEIASNPRTQKKIIEEYVTYQVNENKYIDHLQRAQSTYDLGQYRAAALNSKRAISATKHGLDAYLLLAGSYIKDNQLSKAIQVYMQAASLFPDEGAIEYFLSSIYLTKGDTNKARYHLYRAMKLGYTEYNNYLLLSRIYMKNGEYANATRNLQKAAVQEPRRGEIKIMQFRCLYKEGNQSKALEVLSEVCRSGENKCLYGQR